MKRVTSINGARLLAILIAIILQGCGGSGGGGSDTANSTAAQGGALAPGANLNSAGSEVSIHPKSGPAGSTVAISGRGFADVCGAALSLEKLGGETLAEATISNGAFNVQAVLPETVASGDLVIVGELLELNGQECTQSTGATFETAFGVNGEFPIITLAVLDGRPGVAVDIQGRGFCSETECSAVTLLIDGQVAASGVTVEDDGTFSTGAIVPAIDAAGAVAVVATQTDAGGSMLRGFGELFVTVRPNEEPPVVQ
jgi:hypothetical protein